MGEFGTKYKCFKCETKFYDLGRPLPICPACGEDQNNREPRQTLKRRKRRSSLKMEPDIPVLPEEHDPLAEHEGHDAGNHEPLPDMDEEHAAEHGEDEPQDKEEHDLDEEGDEYGRD